MNTVVTIMLGILSVALITYLLLKKADIKVAMFGIGILLLYIASLSGIAVIKEPVNAFIDPLTSVVSQFKTTLSGAGLVIIILGGYTAYMNQIGANEVTVNVLTKPLKHVKSSYFLVPVVFLLGNLLSLVIPSASNLAIILLATLYPVLIKSKMSPLTAAAVIATTATVMPTPLGSDNVAIAQELGIPVAEYVFNYHAIVSIPTLVVMAIAHYLWQKYCDKSVVLSDEKYDLENSEDAEKTELSDVFKFIYALLPLLPILIMLLVFMLNSSLGIDLKLSVEVVAIISFVIAIICELFRNKQFKVTFDKVDFFFKGMGNSMSIVILLIAASVFVSGLKAIGIITVLQKTMESTSASGVLLPLILVLFTAIIVLLSGSGTALFFAMVPLMVPLAAAASISPYAVTVPMGLAGNLLRAVSPVSAVVMIVAGSTKKEPLEIVKRTSVPMVVGVIFMLILSFMLFK